MRVSECQKCIYHERRSFSTYHEPKNYHSIGFKHIYAYCEKHKKRCRDVRECEVMENAERPL